MIQNLKSTLSRNITNALGWRTNRKIVVIESDDWGSIRMPSKKVFQQYTDLGYNLDSNPYCKYDTLANGDDLNALFEVLSNYKDKNGIHPKFTFNTVMTNPLFQNIKDSGYSKYFKEPFTSTLKQYYPSEDVFKVWKQGINEGLIYPQFHGREHVNAIAWLKELRQGNKPLLDAFKFGFWGIPKFLYENNDKKNIQAAFGFYGEDQLQFYRNNIVEGLDLFKETFGVKSETFIANNYTFPEDLIKTLHSSGIKGIQSMKYHKIPQKNGQLSFKSVYTGKKNTFQQTYTVRNSVFEPSQMPENFDNINNCLKEISTSFFWKKPAIITSHRLNYIGTLDEKNRNRNLKLLNQLIQEILKKWPDVEFMNSNELINTIN